VSGNNSGGDGSGLAVRVSVVEMQNVTVANNLSTSSAGGIHLWGGSTLNMDHSILWNNSPNQVYFDPTGDINNMTVEYSSIMNGQDSIATNENGTLTWGDGNIDVDPMFVDTANGNYHLLASSQLINAGHPDSTDADGTIADIGAYPYLTDNTEPVWYINTAGNDTTGTGTSVNPFASIQAGINFSSDADSVLVAAGTYTENVDFRARSVRIIGDDASTTIVDGNQNGNVFLISQSGAAVLENITIQNGYHSKGAGIYTDYSTLLLKDVNFLNNTASYMGGGMYSSRTNLALDNVTFSNNHANYWGGGIFSDYSDSSETISIVIANSTFESNSADSADGGAYFVGDGQSVSVTNSVFKSNTSNYYTGLHIKRGTFLIEDCEFEYNTAIRWAAAGGFSNNATGIVSRTLVANNTANMEDGGHNSGGFSVWSGANVDFDRCTFVSNSASYGQALTVGMAATSTVTHTNFLDNGNDPLAVNSFDTTGTTLTVSYSNVTGGEDSVTVSDADAILNWGSGNIDVDPMFVDAENDNFQLLASSMLINAGHPDSTDSDGSIADIGTYPYLNSYSGPTWYITESGNDSTATGASDDPFHSIQAGINFSSDDDSVAVAAGTYVENINFRG
ncbi:MAG: hypothetical protein QGE95_15085, partial [Arenicellales bacterium]|nr:hypothetical protein [Arenicellales bacterium]